MSNDVITSLSPQHDFGHDCWLHSLQSWFLQLSKRSCELSNPVFFLSFPLHSFPFFPSFFLSFLPSMSCLLRYNSLTIRYTLLEFIVQWVLPSVFRCVTYIIIQTIPITPEISFMPLYSQSSLPVPSPSSDLFVLGVLPFPNPHINGSYDMRCLCLTFFFT